MLHRRRQHPLLHQEFEIDQATFALFEVEAQAIAPIEFVAHPPIEPYRVEVTQPSHPLVAGIEPFDASDELYLMELHPPFETLLHTRWHGEAKGFAERDWSTDEPRPVMYLKKVGAGEVLYFTLGHARGHYDMRPLMDEYPTVERGSWPVPAFNELLRRSLRWAAGLD